MSIEQADKIITVVMYAVLALVSLWVTFQVIGARRYK